MRWGSANIQLLINVICRTSTVFARSDTGGSLVRIPLKAWMFGVCMHLFCVCDVLCLGSGLATG
jgi:hypothetical protein